MYGEEIFEERRGNLKTEIGKEHVLRIDPCLKREKNPKCYPKILKATIIATTAIMAKSKIGSILFSLTIRSNR